MKECTFHPKITLFKSKSAMKERKVSIGNILKQKTTFLSRNHHLVYSKSANIAPFIWSSNSGLTDKPQSNFAFLSAAPT